MLRVSPRVFLSHVTLGAKIRSAACAREKIPREKSRGSRKFALNFMELHFALAECGRMWTTCHFAGERPPSFDGELGLRAIAYP